MTYTPNQPNLFGQTYTRLVLEGDEILLGEVREPNLVFERVFIVMSNVELSWGGVQIRQAGEPDMYVQKFYGAPIGYIEKDVTVGYMQGQICRLLCTAGQIIFTWRERYRMNEPLLDQSGPQSS